MIEVECECGRVVKTKDENAGKKARCPECGDVIEIPTPRRASSKASPASGKGSAGSAVKSSKKRPVAEDEYDEPDDEDEDFGSDEDDAELPRSKLKKKSTAKRTKGEGDAAESVAKKKKKKKGADDTELNKKIIIGTCIFFGLAFLGLVGFLVMKLPSAASGPKIEVPKDYVDFSSTNGELKCLAPKGWETKTGGGSGGVPPFATFEQGNVKIQFRSSPSGASFQMIAQAGGADEKELPDELKPVSKVHEIQKEKFLQEMSGYEEQGAPEMIKVANGEGRISAFTASEGFSKIFGYRVTLLGTSNQWIVTCKCSSSQWKDFQPVFRKVIESASGN